MNSKDIEDSLSRAHLFAVDFLSFYETVTVSDPERLKEIKISHLRQIMSREIAKKQIKAIENEATPEQAVMLRLDLYVFTPSELNDLLSLVRWDMAEVRRSASDLEALSKWLIPE